MNRRQFISQGLKASVAMAIIPSNSLLFYEYPINDIELLGKGNPELFGTSYKLRIEAHSAFKRMKSEALKSDLDIRIVSSYRSFDRQKLIWERKYNNYTERGLTSQEAIEKIIEYSTIPGTSRHHWGTEIDIIDGSVPQPRSVLKPEHFQTNGSFHKLKLWLDTNAKNFGYHLVYTEDDNRKGFKYEPWHFSYKPLSKSFLNRYLEMNLVNQVSQLNISGSQNFSKEFISKYLKEHICDINPELL